MYENVAFSFCQARFNIYWVQFYDFNFLISLKPFLKTISYRFASILWSFELIKNSVLQGPNNDIYWTFFSKEDRSYNYYVIWQNWKLGIFYINSYKLLILKLIT